MTGTFESFNSDKMWHLGLLRISAGTAKKGLFYTGHYTTYIVRKEEIMELLRWWACFNDEH